MNSEPIANQYERALTLAESGQYEQALGEMLDYLRLSPDDSKALNDAATILFCMRRGEEAISYFEKALMVAQGDEKLQVYWNLCETYIQEGYPDRASELFDQMQTEGILNVDILNRTAEAFLQKDNMGGAMQTLHRSLKISPNQEILIPMMEIIRGRRQTVTVVAERESVTTRILTQELGQLVPVEMVTADQASGMMRHDGLCIFVGFSDAMVRHMQMNRAGGVIVILNEQEIYSPMPEQINWSGVGLVIGLASSQAIDDFKRRTGMTLVVQADTSCEVNALPLYEKKQGKRIAAVGPWTTRQNPMFLIQCFQKLHYIDSDSRLYLAGEFKDEGLKRYLEYTVESMDLENVVFFDGPVKNLSKWFKDKHYIVSTAIDCSSLDGVWLGMAHGLRPVVHQFAGMDEMFDGDYSFKLAEDFCQQIQDEEYCPELYRRMVSTRSENDGLASVVHSLICELEKERPAQYPSTPAIAAQQTAASIVPSMPEAPVATVQATSISMSQQNDQPAQGQMTQMNMTVQPSDLVLDQTSNNTAQPPQSIAEIAQQALEASKSLCQMAQDGQGDVLEQNISTSPQESTSNSNQIPPDSFKYNQQQGLTINDLMAPKQESTGPFCSST